MVALEFFVDGEVFLNERKTAPQCMGCFRGCELLQTAVPHPIVLAEVTIDGLQAVVGLTGNQVRFLSFGIALVADDAFVGQAGAHIVQRRSAGNQLLGIAFVFGQDLRDSRFAGAEQLSQIAIGEQPALLVGLLTQAQGLLRQTLLGVEPLDASVDVVGRAEVEDDRNQVGIRDSFSLPWWVVDADSHPQHLPMGQVLARPNVFCDNLQDHGGTQLANTRTTDSWELLGDPVCEGVLQGFLLQWCEFLADEVRLASHR